MDHGLVHSVDAQGFQDLTLIPYPSSRALNLRNFNLHVLLCTFTGRRGCRARFFFLLALGLLRPQQLGVLNTL